MPHARPFSERLIHTSSGCIEWVGAKVNGYGVLCIKNKNIYAHRYSWIAHKGAIPPGLYVLHKCDNRACVNVEHLFLGTLLDNNRDRAMKGRSRPPRGEQHGSSKLKTADILQIRALLKSKVTMRELGNRYGVSSVAISHIKHGVTWGHVTT